MQRRLLVTHHAPDLDAIGSVWMLKRFDTQHYGTAKVAFVDPGKTISLEEAEKLGSQIHEVTHVDTGLGEFDHHQPERGQQFLSATLLTYEHVCSIHPELEDNQALSEMAQFITEIDHFKEIYWPESDSRRYSFMIHELIKGMEFYDPHNDDSQMQFGLQCLDSAYGVLTQRIKAEEIITDDGMDFTCRFGKCLAIETSNDETIKLAQKQGYAIVVRKDPKMGNIRIKARPDIDVDLKPIADTMDEVDSAATWYYHPSGKMLINGSRKHRNQKASQLSLNEVIAIISKTFA